MLLTDASFIMKFSLHDQHHRQRIFDECATSPARSSLTTACSRTWRLGPGLQRHPDRGQQQHQFRREHVYAERSGDVQGRPVINLGGVKGCGEAIAFNGNASFDDSRCLIGTVSSAQSVQLVQLRSIDATAF
jgi:hypothetical protein